MGCFGVGSLCIGSFSVPYDFWRQGRVGSARRFGLYGLRRRWLRWFFDLVVSVSVVSARCSLPRADSDGKRSLTAIPYGLP